MITKPCPAAKLARCSLCPAGMAPNAMLASFDIHLTPEDDAALRAYLPALPYPGGVTSAADLLASGVSGVALVALRPLVDGDEVLFNYRLSPGFGRPAWYVPVDEREADRRWA